MTRTSYNLKPMIVASIVFHGLIILVFTIKFAFFPDIPEYSPVIRVDLVGLPDKKTPSTPAPAAPPKMAPAKTEVSTPKETKSKSTQKAPPSKPTAQSQSQALSRIKGLQAIESLKAEAESPTPATNTIKGNVISPGTALKGLNRIEFNEYIGEIDAHVKNNWALPEWMRTQDFRAEVLVRIDSNGNLIERSFLKKSGNPDFDKRVWDAIENSSPFPPPPEKFTKLVGVQGITFAFPE